jgi:hypothetical protein
VTSPKIHLTGYIDRRCDNTEHAIEVLRTEARERARLLDEEIDRRITTLKEQITQSRDAMEHRLAGMNEFRDSLRDQDAKNVTRDVLDGIIGGLREQDRQQEERLRVVEARVTADEGGLRASTALRNGQRNSMATIIALTTTALFLISVVVSAIIATRTH